MKFAGCLLGFAAKKKPQDSFEGLRERHRASFLVALRIEGISRGELYRSCGGAIDWLRKRDRKWLESRFPRRRWSKPVISKPSMEWDERDRELASKISAARDKLLRSQGGPKRITKSMLIVALDPVRSIRLDRLPRTASALQGAIESDVEIAIRRLLWEAEYGTGTTIFSVLDKAWIAPPKRTDPQLVRAIEKAKTLLSRRLRRRGEDVQDVA